MWQIDNIFFRKCESFWISVFVSENINTTYFLNQALIAKNESCVCCHSVSEEHTTSFFSPEDRGSMFLRNVVCTYKTTRCHNPENEHRHLHCRENLKSQTYVLLKELCFRLYTQSTMPHDFHEGYKKQHKLFPLYAMEAQGRRGGIAPTHN
jgi:hypothetical protein